MKYFTLLQLNKSIQQLIEGIDKNFWITAEVAQFQLREHAYLELVQKKEEKIVARSRAMVWAVVFDKLQEKIGDGIFEILKEGTEILVQVKVTFHEIHGLSFHVLDLDEKFTIGALELKKRETLQKLTAAQLIDKQKGLHFPIVPQRIAVISSEDAAGYIDFMEQLSKNSYNFNFYTQLFKANVQGQKALNDITQQLAKIEEKAFDVIVLIRGGGSRLDLEVFNEYELAELIAKQSIPVLTGIGHHKDEMVSDIVAYQALKTPTAVAEFIISSMLDYWQQLSRQIDAIHLLAEDKMKQSHTFLELVQQQIKNHSTNNLQGRSLRLLELQRILLREIKHKLNIEQKELKAIERQVVQLDPTRLLKRGFSITLKNGRPVNNENKVQIGDELKSIVAGATIYSKVSKTNEEKDK